MTSASITITPFERQYRRAVDDLLFHSYQLHTHMDWYDPMDWLIRYPAPVRLAWQGGRLAGLIALSNPLNHASWLRVVALNDYAPSHSIMAAMWHDILPELRSLGVRTVWLLIMRNWIKGYLRELDFTFVEDVITLERHSTLLPDLPLAPVTIRAFQQQDVLAVTEIDQAAFLTPWQMTLDEIRQAQRVAEIATVAEINQQVVGFQISTLYRDGAHLARLAVSPQTQGRGVGSILLHDLLRRFTQRQIASITVNTQISNLRSQRLYRTFGFHRNGYDLPVWSFSLSGR